ncbi:hypothetical protein LTR67_006391 [Exophiala xenobiotica]
MLRWLEAYEREGVKGIHTLPPVSTVAALKYILASTVAATEPTPVINNPPAPTPFKPINPAELLVYEEPTLSENELDILFRAY